MQEQGIVVSRLMGDNYAFILSLFELWEPNSLTVLQRLRSRVVWDTPKNCVLQMKDGVYFSSLV